MKEVKTGFCARLFDDIPFDSYIQDFKDSGNKSVYGCTLKEICSVRYNDLDQAIQNCFAMSHSYCEPTFFPHKNGCPKCLQNFAIENKMHKMYFVEKFLPFGASISCLHF